MRQVSTTGKKMRRFQNSGTALSCVYGVDPGRRVDFRSLKKRSEYRRKIIVGHRATSFKDADLWDIEFWQSRSPEERLSALVAIRNDIMAVKGKGKNSHWDF
jgi:hypothetical protein